MKNVLTFLVVLASTTAFAQQKWNVDQSHSTIGFSVSHLVVSETEGRFTKFEGNIESVKPDFTDAKIVFTVDVNSINTDNEMRDKHLKGDDFFNAEKYPQMSFTSTSFKKIKGNLYLLEGNLTIRDVTKKVKFAVTYNGSLKTSKGSVAGFKASTTIDRTAFNLKWNKLTEAGGAMVGKDVTINLKLEFHQ